MTELDKPKAGSLLYVENPSHAELVELAETHGLDVDMMKDGLDPNEAPRIDDWSGRVYVYTRFVLNEVEKQTTSPVLLIFGINMVYVISRKPFEALQTLMTKDEVMTSKRAKVLLQILNEINTGYKARINSVAKRMWAVRSQLNKAQIDNEDFIHFIDMEEDLNDFLSALEPMNTQLNHLLTGKFIKLYEDDKDLMEDLELGSHELISLASSQLKTIRNIREAYSTITANNLNRVFKLMTGITILMGIFTMVTGIYSMNILLPYGHNPNAFWIVIGTTATLIAGAAVYFKKNKWF
jgi:magnesium transporter